MARILISAGEASGEMYGAELITALLRRDPSIGFFGVGGERMRAVGCDTLVDTKDLAVVGITEIISHLRGIYGRYRHLITESDRRKPDLAIVICSLFRCFLWPWGGCGCLRIWWAFLASEVSLRILILKCFDCPT